MEKGNAGASLEEEAQHSRISIKDQVPPLCKGVDLTILGVFREDLQNEDHHQAQQDCPVKMTCDNEVKVPPRNS